MKLIFSHRQLKQILLVAGFLVWTLSGTGCSPRVSHYSSPGFPDKTPFRIAILPLTNLSNDESASEVMGNALTVELLGRGGFSPLDPSYINSTLSNLRIRYADRMNRRQLSNLAAELKDVDGVLVGSVHAYEYRLSDGIEYPLISVHARILSLPDGEILWMADACRRGNDREFILGIGLVESLPQLGQDLSRAIFSTLPDGITEP